MRGARARALIWVLALGLVVHAVGTMWPRPNGPNVVFDTLLYDGLLIGSSVALVVNARRDGRWRPAWLLLGVAASMWAMGDVYWTVASRSTEPPFPNPADALWLTFYAFAYLALFLRARQDLPRLHAAMWLDGLVAGAGLASFATAVVLPALDLSSDSTPGVLVNLAYPIGDLTLLSLVVGVFALFGWRLARSWWVLAAGLAVFAAGDAGYLVQVANGTYVEGSLLDTLWPLGLFLLALAAGLDRDGPSSGRRDRLASVAFPGVVMSGAVTLLIVDHFWPLPPATVILAGLALAFGIARAVLSFRDVLAMADARVQARTDDLTGLGNRRLYFERLDAELRAHPTETLAVLLVDLDRFKEVNDSLGHHVGDDLLRSIGPRLVGALRREDVVTRLGGDEFAVVIPGPVDTHLASVVADRIRAIVAAPFELDGITIRLDASVGIALYPQHGRDPETLLRRADIAMYEAKRGRLGASVYVAGDQDGRQRLQRGTELRQGIERGELVTHFQPICDVPSGTVVGMEALVRWEHPIAGMLPPAEFVPLAEQLGLMRMLTAAVLEQALGACREWKDSGTDIYVSVNLSPSDLLDVDLPRRVGALLAEHGLAGSNLVLEITEDTLMADPATARETLECLRALGVGIAIDDFGKGYSSLSYLRDLPVDCLKLDRAFVKGMIEEPDLRAIVLSVVGLAHSLRLEVVAEGVETRAVFQELAKLGADRAQGWYLGYPVPRPDVTAGLTVVL